MHSIGPTTVLAIKQEQFLSGVIKYRKMIKQSNIRSDLRKMMQYYYLVLKQSTRFNDDTMYEELYNLFWDQYNKLGE